MDSSTSITKPGGKNAGTDFSIEKLLIDQARHWNAGDRVTAERYLEEYPVVAEHPEAAVDLIYGEYRLRVANQENPTAEEYLARFPQFAVQLREQIQFHHALAEADLREPGGASACGRQAVETQQHTPATAQDGMPIVAGFEILEVVGRGGMGVVYKARQVRLKRLVAVKMLLAGEQASSEHLARFRAEAEAAARLHHPNIVQIYEIGEVNGQPFLALEYVDGGSIKQVLGNSPQPPRLAAEYVETLARAMHYAHQQGVVHRDLKPANILLAKQDEEWRVRNEEKKTSENASLDATISIHLSPFFIPKIADFGLAKRLTASITADQTQTGAIIGTPSYMAPEQASGNIREVGPAVDIYSLGAILYELLTGRAPFHGDTPLGILRQVIAEEPLTPSRLEPRVPRDLETISLKCLQKEPRKRYSSALALADDLGRYLAGEPIQARPVGRTEKLWRWCKRKPALAGMIGLAAIAGIIIVAGSLFAAIRFDRIAKERQWEAKLAEARASRFSDQAGRRYNALEALAEAARIRPTAQLRDEAIAALALFDSRPIKDWPGSRQSTGEVDCDGFYRRYVRAELSGDVSVRLVEDDSEMYRLGRVGSNVTLRLSDDGRFLVIWTHNDDRVQLWSLGEDGATLLTKYDEVNFTFGPDSKQIVFARPDGTLIIYGLEEGKEMKRFKTDVTPRGLGLQPGNRKLAISSGNSVHLIDLVNGTSETILELESPAGQLAWHPNGRILAIVARLVDIILCDTVTRKPTQRLRGEKSGLSAIAFSRSGDLLAGSGWDGILRIWDTRTGQSLFQTRAAFGLIRFSLDDRFLGVEADRENLRLWAVGRSSVYRTLASKSIDDPGTFGTAAFAGSGAGRNRLLAVASSDGIVLFDLASATEIGRLPGRATHTVLFDSTGAIWTNGEAGIYRWPVHDDEWTPNRLLIGPREKLPSPTGGVQMACSRDGNVLAIARFLGGLVLRPDPDQPIVALRPHEDVRYVDVSPDGHLVATGSHRGRPAKIWNSSTGELIKELPSPGVKVRFSADGTWLYTSGDGGNLWKVESWERGRPVGGLTYGGIPAFSGDSRLLALDDGGGVIRIAEPTTGRDLARFQDPNRDGTSSIAFPPIPLNWLS